MMLGINFIRCLFGNVLDEVGHCADGFFFSCIPKLAISQAQSDLTPVFYISVSILPVATLGFSVNLYYFMSILVQIPKP